MPSKILGSKTIIRALKEFAVIGKKGPAYLIAKEMRVEPTMTLSKNPEISFISFLFLENRWSYGR
jgi:hypothetical protein